MKCTICADTGRYIFCRVTRRGNVVVDRYGDCPECKR